MHTKSAKLTFYIAHAASLKDKRRVSRGLIDKTRHKFNAAVAEAGTQDMHRALTIGIAVVSGGLSHAVESLDEIIRFMEEAAETAGAELIEVELFK